MFECQAESLKKMGRFILICEPYMYSCTPRLVVKNVSLAESGSMSLKELLDMSIFAINLAIKLLN